MQVFWGEFAKHNFFYYLCTWKWESWKEYQKNTMKNQTKTIFVKNLNKCYYFLDFSQFCPIIHNKLCRFL